MQVNRDWAAIFGRGIVRTTEDFGYQGESPSHPQLLDWLAVDFAAHGWSRKRLHRTLVNTATYRQRSEVTADLLDKDPENLWLARSPRFRIDGELIRDTSLQVASLLTRKLRGPSVYPPQPLSVTTEGTYGGLPWTVSPGEDRYRRGLYTFVKRTAPYAMSTTFDAGSGEACLARREMTNTPLQALTALNDPAMLEAAQSLGVEMAGLKSDDPTTVTQLFQRILTRPPTTEEHQALMTFITQQKARFAQAPEQARQLLESYHSSNSAEPATAAAWSALARVLLNLDETFLHQ